MKRTFFKTMLALSLSVLAFSACKREVKVGILDTDDFGETNTPLKDAADFQIGVAAGLNLMKTQAAYAAVVARDFDAVTFENELKNNAIVNGSGVFNYANADEFVNIATAAGKEVFGHTLAWHSQQAAGYYKTYAGITIPAAAELATNPGFENGLNGWSVFNTGNPAGTSTITATNVASEVRTGAGAMKVVNPTGYPGSQWRVQVSSAAFPTVAGRQYTISYYVKAATAGGSIRLSSGPTAAQYQGDQTIGTAWQLVSWTITASLSSTTFLFDLGQAANTYFIDDVSVKEVVAAPSGGQIVLKVDSALNKFITTTVTRYAGKIKAWDVVNEMFTDAGAIRNNANTSTTNANVFVWSEYLGRDFGYKAFKYAEAADPAAELYINDYNLETAPAKLDSLIAYVNEIKNRGAKVTGIGTQMHISWNTSFAGIENMMKKLAATGLKIRISELDVKTVLSSAAASRTPQLDAYQAAMFKYVVSTYLKYIPAAQRGGITVWGVNDGNSWLSNNGAEFPLLYDNSYNKKPSYGAFLQGLRGQ
jgi:endo-1,4-beta-xylanase